MHVCKCKVDSLIFLSVRLYVCKRCISDLLLVVIKRILQLLKLDYNNIILFYLFQKIFSNFAF